MNTINTVITVLGGLAIFIYGMNLMSDGLKEIAGEKLKTALSYMTRNRFFAILAGIGVTALIQSSSATTVMTVGFVNAGLLSLQQAIGVIFGANVGTTITGQIVSFKLNDIALPCVTLGVIGLLIAKRAFPRGIWRTVLGFGLLFFGMTLMSDQLKVLSSNESFRGFFETFNCTPSKGGYMPTLAVLGAIAVGTLTTMLIQSSSATIGIAIALANAETISMWTAVPIVLGDNIGTTITAAFASIGANANARRTALAHALFNLIGTSIIVVSFFFVYTDKDGFSAPVFFHLINAITEGNAFAGANPGRFVAMAHTAFNVTNVIILASFIPLLAKLCTFIIKDKSDRPDSILEPRLLSTPELACDASVRALADMLRRATTLSQVAVRSGLGEAAIPRDVIQEEEDKIDERQNEIRDYLVAISQHKIGKRVATSIPEIVHCVNDAERISDLALILHARTSKIGENLTPDERTCVYTLLTGIRELSSTVRKSLLGDKSAVISAKEIEHSLLEELKTRAVGVTNIPLIGVFSSFRDIIRHLGNITARIDAIIV